MAVTDQFGRSITYLRLSVTDRCDFRCFYCLPREHRDFQTPASWLSPPEIGTLVSAFALLGVRHVRLTGGEPLVRRELAEITRRIRAVDGIDEVSLSTNAARLAAQAAELRDAGISRVNVSLDTLEPQRFHEITGGRLEDVLKGLDTAQAVGLEPVKVNMVVMRGINDHQVEAIAEYCMAHNFTLRYIETMPVGEGGRHASEHYIDLEETRQRLHQRYGLSPAAMRGSGPARYFQLGESGLVVGFITPMSQHFCDTCNRVRTSVDGRLHLCLGQDDDLALAPLIRSGASPATLAECIAEALQHKPMQHNLGDATQHIIRPMSALGG